MESFDFKERCPYDTEAFCLYTSGNSPLHTHDNFFEFCFFISGSYYNTYNGITNLCSTGHILFFKPGESHSLEMVETGEHYAFIIKEEYFIDYFEKYCHLHNLGITIDDVPSFISKESNGSQVTYLSQLASAIAYNVSPEQENTLHHFLDTLLFACLFDVPTGSSIGIDLFVNDLLRRFDSYRNLDTDITELCEIHPVSKRTLIQRFKELTGHTLVEYRNIKRMEFAAHLLRKENYQISTVANMVDISCLSYFAKQFKQQYGVSPKQYQKMHRTNNPRK